MDTLVLETLLAARRVALFPHINPDWDALGSCLALRDLLHRRGILCDIWTDEPLPFALDFFQTRVRCYTPDAALHDYDVCCAVDCGAANRLGNRADAFAAHPHTLCIDHHFSRTPFASVSYVDGDAPATAQIIFDMMDALAIPLTKEVAQYLYCGLSTDTGSFQYASVTRHTYEVLIALSDCGIDTAALCAMLYERKTLAQLKLKGAAIDSLTVHDGVIATAGVSYEQLQTYGATKDDTDGLASLPRSVAGVCASAYYTEQMPGVVKFSLRSEGDIDVAAVAATFGGGGHRRAAGMTINATIEEALVQVVPLLRRAVEAAE